MQVFGVGLETEIDLKQFNLWVSNKESGAVVGVCGDGAICPLTNYIDAHLNDPALSVHVAYYGYIIGHSSELSENVPHSRDVKRFIRAVDNRFGDITREAVLMLLVPYV